MSIVRLPVRTDATIVPRKPVRQCSIGLISTFLRNRGFRPRNDTLDYVLAVPAGCGPGTERVETMQVLK